MAQLIQCDAHNMEHLADWLVTNLGDGESLAYCNAGYRELMVGAVDAMAQAEADQANAEALARLEAAGPAPAADPGTYEGSDGREHENADQERGVEAKPARIIGRGQSRKAREHRAKVAARAAAAGSTFDASNGPDDDEDDDEDAATDGTAPPA